MDKWPDAEIDIYGLDMTHDAGLSPFDGGSAIRSRSGERWRHECLFLRQLFEPNRDRLRLVGCLFDPSWFS